MALATLSIDINANLARLQEGMDRSTRMLDKLQDSARSTGSTLAAVFTGSVLATGFSEGLSRIVDLFPRLIDGVAAFQDLADVTGASAAGLAGFQTAADVSGVSVSDLAGYMVKLTGNLGKITDESKGAGQALANLGIPMAAFQALRPDEQIRLLSERFGQFEDGVGKTSTALALFGKSGPQILKFFKEYGDGAGQAAKLTAEQIAQADAYADAHARMRSQLAQTAQVLAVRTLPAIDALSLGFKDGALQVFGLQNAAGELASDRSILNWGHSVAIGIAAVADGAVLAGRALYALAGSASVVFADVKLLGQVFTASGSDQISFIRNGTGALAGAFAERNAVLSDAGKRYANLWNSDAQAITKAIDKNFRQQALAMDEGNRQEARRFAERARTMVQKTVLPNVTVRADGGARADAEDKTFARMMARLSKQRALAEGELATGQKLSEVEHARLALTEDLDAAGAKMTDTQRGLVRAEIDRTVGVLAAVAAQRDYLASLKATTAISDRLLQATAAEAGARADANEGLRQQLEEFGQTAVVVDGLRVTRLQHKLALEEEALAMLQNAGASQLQIDGAEQNIRLLRQQIALQRRLLDATKAQANDPQAGATKAVQDFLQGLDERGKAAYDAAKGSADAFRNDLATSLRSGRLDVSKTVDYMIDQFLRLRIVDPLIKGLFGDGSSIAKFMGGLFGGLFANGGAFGASAPIPFAAGGVFNSPHLFKFAQGGAMATGVLGEAGPEAILPLMRGPHGRLGVQVMGGNRGRSGVVIHQVNHIAPGVGANELRAALEANKRATLAAIVEANRRGDSRYSSAA